MKTIKSKRAKPLEVMLDGGRTLLLGPFGSGQATEQEIQSPHFISCRDAGSIYVEKEPLEAAPKETKKKSKPGHAAHRSKTYSPGRRRRRTGNKETD